MRLTLRSTGGGFVGPAGAQTRSVDLDRLPAARAAQLRGLLQTRDFVDLPPTLVKAHPQPWDFQYTLEVEDGGQTRSVRYHLDAAPPALRELTEKLNEVDPD